MIQGGKRRIVCHGTRHRATDGLYERDASAVGQAREGYGPDAAALGDRGGARRGVAGGGGEGWRHGPPDAAGLGDKVQRTGARRPHQQAVAGRARQAQRRAQGVPRHIVEAGPIPAMHGVVRWRACDLIMQLHEKFAISVSDDTVYRALKELGFSHVSARPKAYRQDPEAMEAFKKTLPSVWRKSARSLPRAHR